MKKIQHPIILIAICFFCSAAYAYGQAWRDNMRFLEYSPRYFGPNAFPVPEMRAGLTPEQFEIEVRGQYHYYSGDKTSDIYVRALLPVVKNKAAIEVEFIPYEKYKMTEATRLERHAAETECPSHESYCGDFIISAFYQILRNERIADATFSFTLKTASGGRLVDARFTDAAAYWFDVNVGRDLLRSSDRQRYIRLEGMIGFYCWMTNDATHRQNDALAFGAGLTGKAGNFSLNTNLAGFNGYKGNGDKPLLWRNNIRYNFKNNIISLRYEHGMQDSLYETFSIGYIRLF
jgi:hypothetical protein